MDRKYNNQLVVLVSWGFKPMRNHPIQNRQYNRGRLLMKISPQVGIRKITTDAGGGPEVMQTFPVMNVQICLTDRSRSR